MPAPKLENLNNEGCIYYSDTDCIVLNKNYLINNWPGNNIIQFKLEEDIGEAYFIFNKTYCLILKTGEIIIKTKGILNNFLTLEDFKSVSFRRQNNCSSNKI